LQRRVDRDTSRKDLLDSISVVGDDGLKKSLGIGGLGGRLVLLSENGRLRLHRVHAGMQKVAF